MEAGCECTSGRRSSAGQPWLGRQLQQSCHSSPAGPQLPGPRPPGSGTMAALAASYRRLSSGARRLSRPTTAFLSLPPCRERKCDGEQVVGLGRGQRQRRMEQQRQGPGGQQRRRSAPLPPPYLLAPPARPPWPPRPPPPAGARTLRQGFLLQGLLLGAPGCHLHAWPPPSHATSLHTRTSLSAAICATMASRLCFCASAPRCACSLRTVSAAISCASGVGCGEGRRHGRGTGRSDQGAALNATHHAAHAHSTPQPRPSPG